MGAGKTTLARKFMNQFPGLLPIYDLIGDVDTGRTPLGYSVV
jgi:hypothetical protein